MNIFYTLFQTQVDWISVIKNLKCPQCMVLLGPSKKLVSHHIVGNSALYFAPPQKHLEMENKLHLHRILPQVCRIILLAMELYHFVIMYN